tara:strand:+ start:216970 stop:217641 length:672 start_codon:yes stop_codon:yes gene_type:complete
MSLKNLLFVTLSVLFLQQTLAQHRFEEYNLLGINGGVTFFDIKTENFTTQQGTGFYGGFTTRGSVYEAFDLIYGISYFNNNVGILARDPLNPIAKEQFLDYSISSAQITLLASVNFIRHHFTLEVGPIVNVNGKMKLGTTGTDNYILDGYSTLQANEIERISKVNFLLMGGISTGLRNFRLSGHYQYGVTNMLSALNDQNLENNNGSFSGNSSTILVSGTIYF